MTEHTVCAAAAAAELLRKTGGVSHSHITRLKHPDLVPALQRLADKGLMGWTGIHLNALCM